MDLSLNGNCWHFQMLATGRADSHGLEGPEVAWPLIRYVRPISDIITTTTTDDREAVHPLHGRADPGTWTS